MLVGRGTSLLEERLCARSAEWVRTLRLGRRCALLYPRDISLRVRGQDRTMAVHRVPTRRQERQCARCVLQGLTHRLGRVAAQCVQQAATSVRLGLGTVRPARCQ